MQHSKYMRAIEIEAGSLKNTRRLIPAPLAYQVLIKVVAAGVNRPDVMQRKGLYPPPAGASDIPGLEVAGAIVALGTSVSSLKLGDKVCALVTGGGYAEYCLASAALCLPVPEGLSFVDAAALPEAFFTVWSNVFERAGLSANETLLVHGGSSGIGVAAIQLAKAFNAKVIVTAGTDVKCNFCLELGADAVINYNHQDFVEVVDQFTGHKGVDVILDMIGGDYFPRNLKCMGFDARLLQIGVQNGAKAEINLIPVLVKRLVITGSTLRGRDDVFKADIAGKLLKNVWPLLASGKVKPIIYAAFALEEAAKAHELMESSQHIGKIVLQV